MVRHYDLIIIGGGPAGVSAAIYASRAGYHVAIIEAGAVGGKMLKSDRIENWPGDVSVSGVDLAIRFLNQVQSLQCDIISDEVKGITIQDDEKIIQGTSEVYQAKAIIIATGTKERLLGIKQEQALVGKGISYCAVCDGAFYKEKCVAVIGSGNSAVEEALYLTKFAKKVYIFTRHEGFKAEAFLVKELKENSKIIHHANVEVEDLQEKDGKVSGIFLKDTIDGSPYTYAVDGVFPAIGVEPNTQAFQRLPICEPYGYIVVNEKMETAIPGIYAAGDCIVKNLRQIVTATADGAIAAQSVIGYLKG